jgi:hypothetical protein
MIPNPHGSIVSIKVRSIDFYVTFLIYRHCLSAKLQKKIRKNKEKIVEIQIINSDVV